jgi:predicted ATPase
MITKLSLFNFQAISKAENIEIKPITIICGKNSCGKSSIIRSLLLLKQTLEKPVINESELSMEGDYLHYSHLSDIAHNIPHPNTAKIEYRFDIQRTNTIAGYLGFVFRQSGTVKKSKKGPYISEIYWGPEGDSEKNSIRLEKEVLKISPKIIKELVNVNTAHISKNAQLQLFHFLPNEIIINNETEGKKDNIILDYNKLIMQLSQDLYIELKGIKYLSPLRAIPQRAYLQFSVQDSDIATDGSNVAQYLWLNKDEKVKFEDESVTLISGVNKCLKFMGLDQKISVKRTNRILYQLTASLKTNEDKEVPISDIGFGYSQIIPMIVRGLTVQQNSLTIYEQPEIHLHPSSAASIADLLISFAKDNKRSIVETHSADLINKLRLRIIENPNLAKLVNIIFVEQDENNLTKIRQFQFDEDGMPPEWPIGFIDESQQIAEKIIMARTQK